MNNKQLNDEIIKQNKTETETFFDKLDKKLFGFKGKLFFKKYKSELLLIVITLLLIIVVLYCFIPDNKNKNNQLGGADDDTESMEESEDAPKKQSRLKRMAKASVKRYKSLDTSKGSKAIRSFSKRGIGAMETRLAENKEYLKNLALQIVTFFIVVIVFMPSVSLIIIILITFKILKPKIQYIKSL